MSKKNKIKINKNRDPFYVWKKSYFNCELNVTFTRFFKLSWYSSVYYDLIVVETVD